MLALSALLGLFLSAPALTILQPPSMADADPADMILSICADCSPLDEENFSSLSRAAEDYDRQCRGCHRADGFGAPGFTPPLRDSMGLFLQTPGGREYLVRVPGVAEAPIDDRRLAAVLNYSLRRFSAGQIPPDFSPYSAEEVGLLRRRRLQAVREERRRLILAMLERGLIQQ